MVEPNASEIDCLINNVPDILSDSDDDADDENNFSSASDKSENDSSSAENKKKSPKEKRVVHTTKNDTVDKLYELFVLNNELKTKLEKMTDERDKTEEHLRKTVLAYQTKNELYDKIEKENKKLVIENTNQKKRISKIRDKCLKRKNQFYISLNFLGFSMLYNLFPQSTKSMLHNTIIYYIVPKLIDLLYNKWFIIITLNLIFVIVMFNKINNLTKNVKINKNE
jgi:hypothetical protein